MRMLGKAEFGEIRTWMHRNARPLELAIWRCLFEDGGREAVLAALSWYQNPDGGFGQALEPDNWNPHSTPYATQYAIKLMQDIGFAEADHPLTRGILRYLASGEYCGENGWAFNVPSNDDYPHAPWWNYNPAANAFEGIGVTASLICFILRYAEKDGPLYGRAGALCERLLGRLRGEDNFGDMGLEAYCELDETLAALGLRERFQAGDLPERLAALVERSIERDVSKWSAYTVRPSQYIRSPQSPFYAANREIVEEELAYLLDKRRPGGVWDITWTWFDNGARYAKEFAISENWWKGIKAIENLTLLRNFGRIEE